MLAKWMLVGALLLGGAEAKADDFFLIPPRTVKAAPSFSLPSLQGGGEISLERYRGKVVLVHFWATWCIPCRHEMPKLQRLWQRYRNEGLVVLGINVDRGDKSLVANFAHQYGIDFPILLDPSGNVRNRYHVRGLPTTYILDRKGRFKGLAIGERDWDATSAREAIERMLEEEE